MSDIETAHDLERYVVRDDDGDILGVATFHPVDDPATRHDGWVVEYANGDRLTGDPAEAVANRRLMNGDDGLALDDELPGAWPSYGAAERSIMDSLAYDPNSEAWCLTVRGVLVWFRDVEAEGVDVVLYQSDERETRAGVVQGAPFDGYALRQEMQRVADERLAGGAHV